jgi:AbrB family looped-hinge helix DNA binding protein
MQSCWRGYLVKAEIISGAGVPESVDSDSRPRVACSKRSIAAGKCCLMKIVQQFSAYYLDQAARCCIIAVLLSYYPTVRGDAMSELTLTKVTRKGQMTIPQEFRDTLGIEPGDYVALRPLMGGVLISKVSVTPQVRAEDVLRHLVASLGREAEERGIHEDEDLDGVIEDIQKQIHREHYGQ